MSVTIWNAMINDICDELNDVLHWYAAHEEEL
jgi:hypothetical protein